MSFTHVFSDGRVYDRAYHLNTGGNQDPAHLTLELFDETVRVYGDAAVTSGRVLVRNQNRGGEVVAQSRYTNTYTRRQGRWQIVASQWTRIPPQERAAITVSPNILDAYVGQYELAPNLIITIMREGNRLISEARGRRSELTPETETQFSVPAANLRITFVRNADGQVSHITINDNGREGQARKIR